MLELINDILDLSKLEAGRIEVESIETTVHLIILDVIQIMKVKADEKGIFLRYEPEGLLPEKVESDPGKLRQIITNLIGNAIKFTDKGGVTVVSCLKRSDVNAKIEVSVHDTGIGMTAEQAEMVFNPFAQADSSITRCFGGTGLGLTISQRFAHALGGEITITSEKGKGSTFSISIAAGNIAACKLLSVDDVINSTEQSTETEAYQQWAFPAAKVLVVEDAIENRQLLEVVLGDLGIDIITAVNGQEGVNTLCREAFDLVLMDVQMPVMDGYTAVALMREKGYTLPIFALTAHAMKGDEQTCLDAGFSGYLSKPIDIDLLTEKLAECLGGKRVEINQSQNQEATSLEDKQQLPSDSQPNTAVIEEPVAEKIYSTLTLKNPKFQKIIQHFIETLESKLNLLNDLLKDKNYQEVARVGHWLRGSAGSVGFNQFYELAQNLETYAKESNDVQTNKMVDAIDQLYKRIDVGFYQQNKPEKEVVPTTDRQNKVYHLPSSFKSRLPDTQPKFRAIIEKFAARMPGQLKRINEAITNKDFDTIASLAHWLKGAGGSVGFDAFTEPAGDLEQYAKAKQIEQVHEVANVIGDLTNRISITPINEESDCQSKRG